MIRGINCGSDIDKFDDLNSRALNHVKNIRGTVANKWCEKQIHPITGDIGFRVDGRINAMLTTSERSDLIELTDDWFPISNID